MKATGRSEFPMQWHVEASIAAPKENAFVLTVLRPYRRGRQPELRVQVEESETAILLQAMTGEDRKVILALRKPGADKANIRDLKFTCLALARKGDKEWRLGR